MKRGPYKKYNSFGSTAKIPARTLRNWRAKGRMKRKVCDILMEQESNDVDINYVGENAAMEIQDVGCIENNEGMEFDQLDIQENYRNTISDSDGNANSQILASQIPDISKLTPEVLHNYLFAMVTKWRQNLTYSTTTDIIELLNMKTESHDLPCSVHYFKKIVDYFSPRFEIHNICHECGTYLGKKMEKSKVCNKCDANVNLESEESSFMYLPLQYQLREIFERTDAHNNLYKRTRKKFCRYAIEDIYDGSLYDKSSNCESEIITLNFSVDGAPIFDASVNSAYPVLCTVNELSITERRHNVMLCSLWFGSGKPLCMNGYLTPFVAEAKQLYDVGFSYTFQGSVYRKKAKVLMGVCDSVARPLLRCSTQYNGKFGCGLCLHAGQQVPKNKGTVRVYPIIQGNPFGEGLRSHADTLIHAVHQQKGMKRLSILCDLPWYDIINNLDADWMHCVALGVCRQFANLWFDSKNHGENFYFRSLLHEVDSLLLSFRPTLDVSRSTRPMSDRKHWKAHEWVMFLLCYSPMILKSLFPRKYVHHWALLVDGISILLKKSIMKSELEYVQNCLNEFISGVEYLYGKEHVSFNVHLLAHLPRSVKNWGPLWTHSAFIYEDFNQVLKNYVHSPNGVGIQIFDSFRLKFAIKNLMSVCESQLTEKERGYVHRLLTRNNKPNPQMQIGGAGILGKIERFDELSREKYLALLSINVTIENGSTLWEFHRCMINGEIISSRAYRIQTVNEPKRVNYNVILKNGQVFEVQSFLGVKSGCHERVCIYGFYYEKQRQQFISGRRLQHLIYLRGKLKNLAVVLIEDVESKVIILEDKTSRVAYVHPCGKEFLS